MNNLRINKKELRKFAITMFFTLGILGGFILWRKGDIGFLFWGIGVAFLLGGLFRPSLLGPVYRGWMTMAMWVGFFMTHAILALMYYGVFTPVGLIMRTIGRDPLRMKFAGGADSYWIKRQEREFVREKCEKMF